MQRAGDAECLRVGTECPDGAFLPPDVLRALAPGFDGDVVHLDPGAEGAGDGSRARPYASWETVMGRGLASGDIVALARGRLEAQILLPTRVAVVGACVAETVVYGADPDLGVVELTGAGGALVTNLRLEGRDTGVWVYGSTAPVTLRDLVFDRLPDAAVLFTDAAVGGTVDRVLVLGPEESASEPPPTGILAAHGARVEVRGSVVSGSHMAGVSAVGGEGDTHVSVDDVVVRRIRPVSLVEGAAAASWYAAGIDVDEGASVEVASSLLSGIEGRALGALGWEGQPATSMSLRDVVVRDLSPQPDGNGGAALDVAWGARVDARRVWFDEAYRRAIEVDGVGAKPLPVVSIRQAIVRRTRPGADDGVAMALGATRGASVRLEQALVADHRVSAVTVEDERIATVTELALVDVVIRDVAAPKDERLGAGVGTRGGARTVAERLWIERAAFAGVVGSSLPGERVSTLQLSDLVVRDTLAVLLGGHGEVARAGLGLFVVSGAEAEVSRGLFEGNTAFGIFADTDELEDEGQLAAPPRVRLSDITVLDTLPVASGFAGGAIGLGGGHLILERARLVGNRSLGIVLVGVQGQARSESALTDVMISECDGPVRGEVGAALVVAGPIRVRGQRLALVDNGGAGVVTHGERIEERPELYLGDLHVARTRRAACGLLPEGAPGRCIDGQDRYDYGLGVVATGHAALQLDGFLIEQAAVAGIVLAEAATLSGRTGIVRDNGVGLNLLTRDPQSLGLEEGVFIHDNGQEVTRVEMELPDLGALLGGVGGLAEPGAPD